MPTINVRLEPTGPLITVFIGVSGPRRTALLAAGVAVPSEVTGTFLIDTGASSTVVDPDLIRPLELPQRGIVGISTPSTQGGQHDCPQYDASLFIPGGSQQGLLIQAMPIIETHLKSQGIDGLIGRDVLDRCVLYYNGPGRMVSLSY